MLTKRVSHSEITILRVIEYVNKNGPVARSKIARDLQLSKATITQIVRRLQDDGLVQEVEQALESRRTSGRRPMPIQLNPQSGLVLGVDLSSAKVGSVAVDMSLTPKLRLEFGPLSDRIEQTLDQTLRSVLDGMLMTLGPSKSLVQGIGVAVRGLNYLPDSDVPEGLLNLEEQSKLVEAMEKRYQVPVLVVHNINALLVAEMLDYQQDHLSSILLHIGEGVSGAIWIDGDAWVGSHLAAGEWGHVPIDPKGPLCACGNRGCFETRYSIPAIIARAHAEDADIQTWEHIVERMDEDKVRAILNELACAAVAVLAGAVALIDPARIIVQGPILDVAPVFLPMFREELTRSVLPKTRQSVVVAPTIVGADAAALGASYLMVGEALARMVHKWVATTESSALR